MKNRGHAKLLLALALQDIPMDLARGIVRGLRESLQDINHSEPKVRWAILHQTLSSDVVLALQLFGLDPEELTGITFNAEAYQKLLDAAAAIKHAMFTEASRERLVTLLTAMHKLAQDVDLAKPAD